MDPMFLTDRASDGRGDVPRENNDEALAVADEECHGSGYFRDLREQLRTEILASAPGAFDRESILEQIGRRAHGYYQLLWTCSTPSEKLLLQHLGAEGLVNYTDQLTAESLVRRGLVRRAARPRLFNETFRRFALSPDARTEVRVLELASSPSRLDRRRLPFWGITTPGLVVFIATQGERLLTMLAEGASITALTAFVTALSGVLGSIYNLLRIAVEGRPASASPRRP